MPTTVKEIPGFNVVAHGSNIVAAGPPTQYLVANINPYPNADLIVGNTYNISDTGAHGLPGIVVELMQAPGGGMQTATFQQQT